MDDQLLREFLAEAEDLVEVLYEDVEALRARHGEGRARRSLVGRIFRHVHTIKGSAAAVGLEEISQFAHELETLLDALRMGRVTVDASVLEALEEAVGSIAAHLGAAARGELRGRTLETQVATLRRLASRKAEGAERKDEPQDARSFSSLPAEITRDLSDYEQRRLHEARQEGARVMVVAVEFDLADFDERFRQLSEALSTDGEVIATLPGMSASAPERIGFRLVYATAETPAQVSAQIADFGASLLEDTHAHGAATTKQDESGAGAARTLQPQASALDAVDEGLPVSTASGEPLPSVASLTKLVRVPLDELDDLISATHELLNDTSVALDLALTGELPRAERTELEIRAPRIRRRFFELEERLIELRMIPVGQTLERAARAGQRVARTAGREVDFEIAGGDVRLDKSLADTLADPLLHLLRNAVDHGIEPATERARAGKSARGRIRLEASAAGSRVMLRVSDDGRGIDPASITQVAVKRGLIHAEEYLTTSQALRLIFRPGFSTAEELSSVSGRGVGLDIVEQTIEQAGGEMRVWSRPGAGTTFEMHLPTTLALVPSLIVRSARNRYCIDASHIVEACYLAPADLSTAGDDVTARWRGTTLPLISLRTLLGQNLSRAAEGDAPLPVIISHVAGRETDEEQETRKRVAVTVDGWDGHSDVLVRGLGRHGPRWRGVSGATELRDGSVALMLDLPRLLEMAASK